MAGTRGLLQGQMDTGQGHGQGASENTFEEDMPFLFVRLLPPMLNKERRGGGQAVILSRSVSPKYFLKIAPNSRVLVISMYRHCMMT